MVHRSAWMPFRTFASSSGSSVALSTFLNRMCYDRSEYFYFLMQQFWCEMLLRSSEGGVEQVDGVLFNMNSVVNLAKKTAHRAAFQMSDLSLTRKAAQRAAFMDSSALLVPSWFVVSLRNLSLKLMSFLPFELTMEYYIIFPLDTQWGSRKNQSTHYRQFQMTRVDKCKKCLEVYFVFGV